MSPISLRWQARRTARWSSSSCARGSRVDGSFRRRHRRPRSRRSARLRARTPAVSFRASRSPRGRADVASGFDSPRSPEHHRHVPSAGSLLICRALGGILSQSRAGRPRPAYAPSRRVLETRKCPHVLFLPTSPKPLIFPGITRNTRSRLCSKPGAGFARPMRRQSDLLPRARSRLQCG